MGDCVNAEIRDLLPDLLHGRLDTDTRARVEAHVAACAECTAELALLRRAAAALAVAPRVDAERIVAALPQPGSVRRPRPIGMRMLRLAAAILIAVLAVSVLKVVIAPSTEPVLVRTPEGADPRSVAPIPSGTDARRAADVPSPTASRAPGWVAARTVGLTMVGGIDALSAEDLAGLVAAVESLESTPSDEPDPLSLPVGELEEEA